MLTRLPISNLALTILGVIAVYAIGPGLGKLMALSEDIDKTPKYLVGGDIFNLNGMLKLRSQSGEIMTLTPEQRSYYFKTSYKENTPYSLTIVESPIDQKCLIQKSKGNLIEDISDANITCHYLQKIEGKARGLKGEVILGNKGTGEKLPIVFNGSFALKNRMIMGETYHIEIIKKSEFQTCEIKHGHGVIQGHVKNIELNCSDLINHRELAGE